MIERPRGTRDFLPDDMERRRHYEGLLRGTAKTFGFREVATPIFEEAELFIARSGPNVLKELYAFKDKGDREIALRPEMTAAVIRMFVNEMSNDRKIQGVLPVRCRAHRQSQCEFRCGGHCDGRIHDQGIGPQRIQDSYRSHRCP